MIIFSSALLAIISQWSCREWVLVPKIRSKDARVNGEAPIEGPSLGMAICLGLAIVLSLVVVALVAIVIF